MSERECGGCDMEGKSKKWEGWVEERQEQGGTKKWEEEMAVEGEQDGGKRRRVRWRRKKKNKMKMEDGRRTR